MRIHSIAVGASFSSSTVPRVSIISVFAANTSTSLFLIILIESFSFLFRHTRGTCFTANERVSSERRHIFISFKRRRRRKSD